MAFHQEAGAGAPDEEMQTFFKAIERISDQSIRYEMGRRFERFVGETFNVVRWTVLVGLFRYLSVERDSLTLKILYWASASLLFAYIASRFLLRPEIRIFQEKDSLAKSLTQSLVNFLVCVIVFLLVIILVEDLVSNVPQLKAGYGG